MAKKSKFNPAQIPLMQLNTRTAPCVPAIREAVQAWAAEGYAGVTNTTRILLNHWFHTDHRLRNGGKFAYHYFQREAIETLIYLYEVAEIQSHKAMIERYAEVPNLRLLQYDWFPRYALKLATGSGKTKIISLAIAWQYFNAVNEPNAPRSYAATSLLIAPNTIVYDRLKDDFENKRVFRTDPIIPPELEIFWDLECYMRDDAERASSAGALYLANIQQLYDSERGDDDEPDIMTAMLGGKPPAQPNSIEKIMPRLTRRDAPVFVVNDEAHHTHDEESEWSRTLRRLHSTLTGQEEQSAAPALLNAPRAPGVIQLDMSATPRYSSGALFTWTVYDYPLKQAILDKVVKRPIKGVAKGMEEVPSDIASERYQAYLTAGVKRWQEYRDQLQPLKRKPVLFVMLNSTREADDVADFLRRAYPEEFRGDKLHVIHTNKSGDIARKDEQNAREIARNIDEAESPVNCIVSVLMLREGWDVQSVTVVVGLRPYSSKAAILPEQTVGRGLRLMFRGLSGEGAYVERVDVIGNKAFIEFVEQLERDEDLQLETADLDKEPVRIETILPDPEKAEMDITLPVLSPMLVRKTSLSEEIAALDVRAIRLQRPFPRKASDLAAQQFRYEGYDLITLEKMIERDYELPQVKTSQEVIGYYAKRIAQELKLPSQFAALAPKVQEFLQQVAFGEPVDLEDPQMVQAIAHKVVHHVTVREFVNLLREVVVAERAPELVNPGRALSTAEGFPWSRKVTVARKTIFNLVAAENNFELAFARFLESAPDVARFAKLPERFNFTISYTDSRANLRYYEPDFVAVLSDGTHMLLETKGREDVDVQHKDRAAILWCENASALTGTAWGYKKIPQGEFEKLRPTDFDDVWYGIG